MTEKDLYLPNGFLNMKLILNMMKHMKIVIMLGARNIGKSFGMMDVLRDWNCPYLLVRRTATQLDNIAAKELNPYGDLAFERNFDFKVSKAGGGVYKVTELDEDGKDKTNLAYMTALSTFANLRSWSTRQIGVKKIVYDEFIPERSAKRIKNEFDAWANLVATVSRYREDGQDDIQVILMANSNDLTSPILAGYGISSKVQQMQESGQTISILPEKEIGIIYIHNSPISEKMRNEALYKATAGSNFAKMAYDNEFSYDDTSDVCSKNLKGYIPIVMIDDITIYKQKNGDRWYASPHSSGSVEQFNTNSKTDRARLLLNYAYIYLVMVANRMDYESFEIKSHLMDLFL